ncbi:MAG: hypothetical protein EHM91_06475 [Planctomycetota bacterium]|nr:MAG: hypothetical protein EHM91_06475 [Planctomycetota bacterium]
MAATHGKLARVNISASVATTSTNVAGDLAVDKRTLTIAESSRRHWTQGSTMPRVYGATTNTEIGSYTVDHVRGIVTFATDHSTAVNYKVDCAWYQTSFLGMTRSWSLDVSQDMADVTCFSSSTGGVRWRQFEAGLNEGTIKLGRIMASSQSSAPAFVDRQALDSPLYVELLPGGTAGDKFECYARIQGDAWQTSLDGPITEDVTLKVDGKLYWTTST